MEWHSNGLSGLRAQNSEWQTRAVIRVEGTLALALFSSLDEFIARLKGRTSCSAQCLLLWILAHCLTNLLFPHRTIQHSLRKHTNCSDLLMPLSSSFWKSCLSSPGNLFASRVRTSMSLLLSSPLADWVLPPPCFQGICRSMLCYSPELLICLPLVLPFYDYGLPRCRPWAFGQLGRAPHLLGLYRVLWNDDSDVQWMLSTSFAFSIFLQNIFYAFTLLFSTPNSLPVAGIMNTNG